MEQAECYVNLSHSARKNLCLERAGKALRESPATYVQQKVSGLCLIPAVFQVSAFPLRIPSCLHPLISSARFLASPHHQNMAGFPGGSVGQTAGTISGSSPLGAHARVAVLSLLTVEWLK